MRCPDCATPLDSGVVACSGCGASIVEHPASTGSPQWPGTTSCPHCHAGVPNGASFCGYCGTALTGRHGRTAPYPPSTSAGRARIARLPWPAIAVAAVVSLVVMAATALLWPRQTPAGFDDTDPGETVHAYFTALTDRDADRTRALLDERADDQADPRMLGAAVLRDPGYTPPVVARVEMLHSLTDSATVRTDIEVAGARQQMDLTLLRGEGERNGWKIRNPLLPLPLPRPSHRDDVLLVAGVAVPVMQGKLDAVFPGAYLMTLRENPVREATPITVRAGNGDAEPFLVRLRPTVRQVLEPQVRAYLDACAARKELEPAHCPWRAVSSTPVSDVVWRITVYPTLDMRLDSGGNVYVDGQNGTVEVTGRTNSPPGPTFVRSMRFDVFGRGQVIDGRVVFQSSR